MNRYIEIHVPTCSGILLMISLLTPLEAYLAMTTSIQSMVVVVSLFVPYVVYIPDDDERSNRGGSGNVRWSNVSEPTTHVGSPIGRGSTWSGGTVVSAGTGEQSLKDIVSKVEV
ncbi:hypothetical protein HDU76_001903 [Blyttiomyces sp. JEL0837]|nr:hypothetical protein HDU76_001903 [Blyttiomyces sp. JEL0837]